jgi:2-keto-3-deoxy-L-rhamnonate aldolase RhmA
LNATLRERLHALDTLVGSFIKTPTHHAIEIAGLAGLDFVALDAEHAPFGADSLDRCLLACAAAGIPGIVRLRDGAAGAVLQALDLGAAGVLVPHVSSRAQAQAIVSATRYSGGLRGFSNSPRAGRYGRATMTEHRAASDAHVTVIAQIEDREGLEHVDQILATEGIDALLIGRADLAVAFEVDSIEDPLIEGAIQSVVRASNQSGVACGIFVAEAAQVDRFRDMGMRLFIVGSDQSTLMHGWTRLMDTTRAGVVRG